MVEQREREVVTSLRNGDDVAALDGCRDRVSLNRSWILVTAQLDVLHHDGMQASVVEL